MGFRNPIDDLTLELETSATAKALQCLPYRTALIIRAKFAMG
jgi:hypothetical protein